MRCLHDEALKICEYASALGLVVTRCDVENKSPPAAVEASAIGEMLKRSETLWGTALPYYLCVSETFAAKAPSLKQAVMQVEASPDGKKFLIIAYQDGGLISVSGAMLPFQIDARTAEWWAPYKSGSARWAER
jgi:hypothetical protein